MMSLKTRLMVWVSASAIVLTTLAGLSLYMLARSYLIRQFDASLAHKARVLFSTIKFEHEGLDFEFEDLNMSEFASPEAGGYFQVWMDGRSYYRSPSLGPRDLPTTGASDDLSSIAWVELSASRLGRGVVQRVASKTSNQVELTLCLARDADAITRALRALQYGLTGVGAVLTLVMSLMIRYAVGRGMHPVEAFAAQLGVMDERSLDRRIDPANLPSELEPIAEQFNGLLERLHKAFERERSFSADVAHELRTPLAGLRATVEVARSKPRTQEEHADCLDQLLTVCRQMQTMVERLLQLSALETNHVQPVFQKICIDQAIQDAWRTVHRNGADAKPFDIKRSLRAGASITTDPALIAVVLHNVLGNAITYVNPGGEIAVSSCLHNDGVEISVANTGSRVAARDAERVFDRFWRADASRSKAGGRFGLGLALTHTAVQALDGAVHATSEPGGRFIITIDLPDNAASARQ